MKYTLCLTRQCNLACSYCYIAKKDGHMDLETACKIIDFAYTNTPPGEKIQIGFFGGEPLLAFDLIKKITAMATAHPLFDSQRVELDIVSNGTIFNDEIASFIIEHDISFGISCDGPPKVQDRFRRFRDGRGSSATVEANIRTAVNALPVLLANAVYHPATYLHLPAVIAYLSSLGLNQIYLNPDYSAHWTEADAQGLATVYGRIGQIYIDRYTSGAPLFHQPDRQQGHTDYPRWLHATGALPDGEGRVRLRTGRQCLSMRAPAGV